VKAVVAAACLAAVPAAALAQPAAFVIGRDLRLAGRAAEAIPHLEAASRASPADADVWLNLGLALAAAQRYDDADRALAQAARIAPDYADVQLAQARVAFYRGDLAEADRRLGPIAAGAERDALARQVAEARADRARPWQLDVALARSGLSGAGLEDWLRASVGLSRRLDGGRALSVAVEQSRQFGLEDTYLEAGVAARRGYLAVGGTPEADYRPEWQVRGGWTGEGRALGGGWTASLSADASWARYASGEVRSLQPGLTFGKGDGFLHLRWINTLDERDDYRSGYSVRGVYAATPDLRLSAGWADAPESSQGVTVDVRAVTAGVAIDLDRDTTVRLDGTHERRSAYDRTELAVAVSRRF
jgi:YaiO family outer membrane protein